jgi:predicted ribosomally synthesized peptide with SipW-like signal peptide
MGVAYSECGKACHGGWPTETMSKKKLELTRRRVLGGLGTIGVASAAAGLGTSAYLNDTESFENNMMTAGELDLAVDYVVHEEQGSAGDYTINSFTNEVNGSDPGDDLTVNGDGTAMSQNLGDVKPGDSGYSRFCFTIDDNPAYMWACGELTASNENGYTEPEPEDDNGEGELEENIEVDVMYCDLDDEGNLDGEGGTIYSGTLKEVLDQLHGGIPLDGTGDADAMPGEQSPYAGTGPDDVSGDVTNPCLCFDWEVPTSVGNEIQGDSLEFDLSFHAAQSRHNDGTHNPCLEGETGEDFAKFRDDFSPTWNARGIIGNNDASQGGGELSELDIRDADDNELAGDEADYENGVAQSFTLEYTSGGDASLTVGGDTVSLSGAPAPDDDDAAITVKTSSGNTVSVSNVQVNGATPSNASSVSASGGDTSYLFLAGGGVSAGDTISGDVTFSWSGSEPDGEAMGFRIDA